MKQQCHVVEERGKYNSEMYKQKFHLLMSVQYDKTTAGAQFYGFEVFIQGIYRPLEKVQRRKMITGLETMIYGKKYAKGIWSV